MPLAALRPAPLTIGTRIFLLVVGAILATALAFIAITRFGPPPVAEPVPMRALVHALKTGQARAERDRTILIERSGDEPDPRGGERRDPALEAALAQEMGRDRQAIRAYSRESALMPPVSSPMGRPPPFMPGNRGAESAPPAPPMPFIRGEFTVAVRSADGWRIVRTGPDQAGRYWRMVVGLSMAGVILLLSLLGWWVARRIARPLLRLADAAREARSGHRWAYRPEGASPEIIAVADALAAYDARHQDHFRQQSALLAGIAHDLGTPLTRLAFRLEALPAQQRDTAFLEVEHMRTLIADGMVMARSSMARRERVDMGALAQALAERCSTERTPVTVEAEDGAAVLGEPTSLTRLIQNLIDNAQVYGGGGRVLVSRGGGRVRIVVEDEGPGIEEARLATICDPFVGSGSTRRPEGSNGLGLAIARSIVDRHDGDIIIGNRAPRGLRVTIDLPAAPGG